MFQKLKDQEEEDSQRRKQNLIRQRQELNEQDAPQGETAKPQ
jgi:hypothetical protein